MLLVLAGAAVFGGLVWGLELLHGVAEDVRANNAARESSLRRAAQEKRAEELGVEGAEIVHFSVLVPNGQKPPDQVVLEASSVLSEDQTLAAEAVATLASQRALFFDVIKGVRPHLPVEENCNGTRGDD